MRSNYVHAFYPYDRKNNDDNFRAIALKPNLHATVSIIIHMGVHAYSNT